ncbi:molybdopterin-guanine dinucleotide biosynthesis protein MobB [uncultured Veillonella sp.]|uniref:molybdopterin-guanine dinucleotide biosynthesis protein MobB n=1 Tax=uncultured Veillonella sp. TaxID=159268 RepID=UPI002590EFDA|nr:molybdopterin-guanine dinucleotide biosynthesis protein MobB [uncultured Veillonella sp.]
MTGLGYMMVAGGMSTRMGRDKASLPWMDGTLLSSLAMRAVRSYSFTHLCVVINRPLAKTEWPGRVWPVTKSGGLLRGDAYIVPTTEGMMYRWQPPDSVRIISMLVVSDRFKECGPLAGVEAGLRAITAIADAGDTALPEYYLTVSVDMPFYEPDPIVLTKWQKTVLKPDTTNISNAANIANTSSASNTSNAANIANTSSASNTSNAANASNTSNAANASNITDISNVCDTPYSFMPRQEDGRLQPLAAIYHRRCGDIAKELLEKGERRMQSLVAAVPTVYVPISSDNRRYRNVNTPLAYKEALAYAINRSRTVPIVTVTANRSKTGKTRVATELIRRLTNRGIAVGLVKSDGHGFTMDYADTDTGKATAAVAISGPNGYALLHHTPSEDSLLTLAQSMQVDVALLESRRHGSFPKIVVLRQHHMEELPCEPQEVLAIVSDGPRPLPETECRYFSFDEGEALATWLLERDIFGRRQ